MISVTLSLLITPVTKILFPPPLAPIEEYCLNNLLQSILSKDSLLAKTKEAFSFRSPLMLALMTTVFSFGSAIFYVHIS
jgi:hypothetical protein